MAVPPGELRRAGLGGSRHHRDRRALRGEPAGNLGANAAARAGHDGDPAVQQTHSLPPALEPNTRSMFY
jgi:hypothetical protein